MYMTSKKEEEVNAETERKHTVLVTADIILNIYQASEKTAEKNKKRELYNAAVFLSQHLNKCIPLKKSQYSIQ